MKIYFEYTKGKIRDKDSLEEALHILENESKQGFFKSNVKSYFKKYNERSIIEDARNIELHVVKVYGRGEYKLVGSLSYNQKEKEVKFYIINVFKNDSFKYEDDKMAEVYNIKNNSHNEDIVEMKNIISKIKKAQPEGTIHRKYKYEVKNTPNPKRMEKSESAKRKTEKNYAKKNFRFNQKRNVSNNKKNPW